MPTKAGEDFRNTKKLDFKEWYAGYQAQRVLWKRYNELTDAKKKDTMMPYVILDRPAVELPLIDLLSPLIEQLKEASQKYYPFIFKPELGASHFVAGVLRKNKDDSVSLVMFNPLGVPIRNTWYKLALKTQDKMIPHTLYLKIKNKRLEYTQTDSRGIESNHYFDEDDLKALDIKLDLDKPLSIELIKNVIRPKIDKLLDMTCRRKHTKKQIEIINSSAKIQTEDRDEGGLNSCGPLTLEFIDFVISNPQYMETIDKSFVLPDFLKSLDNGTTNYKEFLLKLRQKHCDVLDRTTDSELVEVEQFTSGITKVLIEHSERNEVVNDDAEAEAEGESWDGGVAADADADDDWGNNDATAADESGDDVTASAADMPAADVSIKPAVVKPTEKVEPKPHAASVARDVAPATPPKSDQRPPLTAKEMELRADVKFIRKQIERFEKNAKSFFSINNEMKAKKITEALTEALKTVAINPAYDVREDQRVKEALAIHRIFGFFGCKSTTATAELKESLVKEPLAKDPKP